MKKEIITCDVCESEDSISEDIQMQVVFTTEQNEGRAVKPYFEIKRIDICAVCYNRVLDSKRYMTATGAMGYNDYKPVHNSKDNPTEKC